MQQKLDGCCKNCIKKSSSGNLIGNKIGNLIGNKIADKITSIGKPKAKEKPKEIEETYIPPEKSQQIIDDLRLFWMQNVTLLYENGISKNCKLSW